MIIADYSFFSILFMFLSHFIFVLHFPRHIGMVHCGSKRSYLIDIDTECPLMESFTIHMFLLLNLLPLIILYMDC